MAATQYSKNPVIIENVTYLGKPAWKTAAAFVVLTGLPVTPAKDVRRLPQAKVFSEPEVFVSPMKGNLLVTGTTLNPAFDVRRQQPAKYFQEPDFFISQQKGYAVVVLASYTMPAQQFTTRTSIIIENIHWVRPQRGSLTTLGLGPIVVQSADIMSGQDTYGWPPEPDPWYLTWKANAVIVNSATAYSPATDVRRGVQAKFFGEPESFPKAQTGSLLSVIGFVPYSPATDVIALRPQAKIFSEPETFVSPMPNFIGRALYNFAVYNPATDVRRALQARVFSDPEVFLRPAPFNALVINGHAFIPPTPIESPEGLDIYDYLDGAVLLAWGQFLPGAQSFNIYQRSVTFTPVEQPPANAFGVSAGPYIATPGPWAQIAPVFLNALNCVVTGLQIASYNSGTQVLTPAMTYDFKVVAVINGAERGSVHKRVTPGPQSVMLTTPMKRLWPFPNTGLD